MSRTTARRNQTLQDFKDEGPWYVGLHTAAFNANGAGGTEVDVAEYARQLITFSAPNNGVMSNVNQIIFPTPTTTGGYGVIVQLGLYLDPNPATAATPEAMLEIPAGSFSMPVGYSKAFEPDYLTMEERAGIL